MRSLPTFLLLIPLVLSTGLYFFFSYRNGGICFKSPVCTEDIKTLCNPTNAEKIWQGPSLCSCGPDANILKSQGWIDCEVPEGYKGQIQTRATLTELPVTQIPETLPLFIVPLISLSIGIGAIAVLWTKKSD